MKFDLTNLLKSTIDISQQAGHAILKVYETPNELEINIKQDKTPVTQADLIAHEVICKALKTLTPAIPILSEEDAKISYSIRQQWNPYWLVDPLDGTKEFIHRTHEFTVNIALIENGRAILGVIYVPYYDITYFASKNGGCFKQQNKAKAKQIVSRKKPQDECVLAISRRHSVEKAKVLMQKIPNHKVLPKGSSLKSCVIAEGLADIYPSFGPTSEWDMGAAQCIIEEAGGAMLGLDLKPIQFNQKASLLNPPLIVVGDPEYDWGQFLSD